RLAGLSATTPASAAPGEGLYSPEMTRRTYERLHEIAAWLLEAGLPVIIDATFLKRAQRDRFRDLPAAPLILRVEADRETLRRHVEQRARAGNDPSDADLAVLERQLESEEPPAEDEPCQRMRWDESLPEALFSSP
ncbi:MAG: ATP-binding protein, partial [Gammaproteobacteria bacterium]